MKGLLLGYKLWPSKSWTLLVMAPKDWPGLSLRTFSFHFISWVVPSSQWQMKLFFSRNHQKPTENVKILVVTISRWVMAFPKYKCRWYSRANSNAMSLLDPQKISPGNPFLGKIDSKQANIWRVHFAQSKKNIFGTKKWPFTNLPILVSVPSTLWQHSWKMGPFDLKTVFPIENGDLLACYVTLPNIILTTKGIHPRKLTSALKRYHFNKKGSSSNHYISEKNCSFRGGGGTLPHKTQQNPTVAPTSRNRSAKLVGATKGLPTLLLPVIFVFGSPCFFSKKHGWGGPTTWKHKQKGTFKNNKKGMIKQKTSSGHCLGGMSYFLVTFFDFSMIW